jgi:hypothetical protein
MLDLRYGLVPVYPDLTGPAKIHCDHNPVFKNERIKRTDKSCEEG